MQSRDNVSRVFAIAGLLIGVIALTIGFAAFNQSLVIRSSAEVDVADTPLNIGFSTATNAITPGSVTPTVTGVTGATAEDATLSSTTISGIHAVFTKPGQKATYAFKVYNASPYVAYLNSIVYDDVESETSPKVCKAAAGTTQTYVNNACNGITITVTVGLGSYIESTNSGISQGSINHSLAGSSYEDVTVDIEYASGSSEADGDFTVDFGDITLNYSTVQATGA